MRASSFSAADRSSTHTSVDSLVVEPQSAEERARWATPSTPVSDVMLQGLCPRTTALPLYWDEATTTAFLRYLESSWGMPRRGRP